MKANTIIHHHEDEWAIELLALCKPKEITTQGKVTGLIIITNTLTVQRNNERIAFSFPNFIHSLTEIFSSIIGLQICQEQCHPGDSDSS